MSSERGLHGQPRRGIHVKKVPRLRRRSDVAPLLPVLVAGSSPHFVHEVPQIVAVSILLNSFMSPSLFSFTACSNSRPVRNRGVDLLDARIKQVYLTRIFATMNG